VKEDYKEEIERLMEGIVCANDFKCCKSRFNDLCEAQEFGLESFLVCLEKDPKCKFSYAIGSRYFCQCPLRAYLAKKLGK
jgi:hypothetical protein